MGKPVPVGLIFGHEPPAHGQPSEIYGENKDGDEAEEELRDGYPDHSCDRQCVIPNGSLFQGADGSKNAPEERG
jgi:hypothetical protein